jgi:hypothetical protein
VAQLPQSPAQIDQQAVAIDAQHAALDVVGADDPSGNREASSNPLATRLLDAQGHL